MFVEVGDRVEVEVDKAEEVAGLNELVEVYFFVLGE